MDEIATIAKPVIILTGGEPLMRADIFDLAQYGTKKGFRMVMATNGTLITEENVKAMINSGIQRISVSLDGPDAETHDAFRKVKGAFEGSLRGVEIAKKHNLPFQINTTITKNNLHLIQKILHLAIDLGAVAHHIFLLVPTGRGKELQDHAYDVDMASLSLIAFAMGLPGYVLIKVLVSGTVSRQDTRTPVRAGVAAIGIALMPPSGMRTGCLRTPSRVGRSRCASISSRRDR